MNAYQEAMELSGYHFDETLEPEVQTSKSDVKVVPCRECARPLVVNRFYAPANARCSACKGDQEADGTAKGTVGVPKPGVTDPAKAVNLADCLINAHFARALCPAHPDDEAHVMELKSVSHSEHYGPSELVGYKNGRPEYRQIAPGETAMHQCLKCRAVVTYSTTHQAQYRRKNEVDQGRTSQAPAPWRATLGVREEALA